MMNLFQHLIKSTCSETLKRVQGDRKILFQRSLFGFAFRRRLALNDIFFKINQKIVIHIPTEHYTTKTRPPIYFVNNS